ncbi:MAG: helix-turn-helix domain-containing protein [Candidatus Contendobacter sp.]|nr:helix-turn-helix domain-containing protein [Candidatus Contendobacter sp.]MDG4555984.1 helix-turn-helix domain-containing protein [Candidatus Contendobacter sp.]
MAARLIVYRNLSVGGVNAALGLNDTHQEVVKIERLAALRRARSMTQQIFADAVGLHVTQIKRYESGAVQPSLEALKKIARTFGVTTDFLLFAEGERGPDEALRLQFDVIAQLADEEKEIIRELIEGMILKYQARRWVGTASTRKTAAQ